MLLKNEGGILPLALETGQTLAVIGEFAERPRYQGAGSSQVNPTRVDTLLDGLRAGVPDGVEVARLGKLTPESAPPEVYECSMTPFCAENA